MNVRILAGLALVACSFLAQPAHADCQTATLDAYPDINYVTACALDQNSVGDPSQTTSNAYVLHLAQAFEADPAFAYSHAQAQQSAWQYDDGTTQQDRHQTDLGAGAFEGARGLVGTGFQADVNQRDQTVPEDDGSSGACSWYVGHSTCAGASGWLTVQDVASVGVGGYWSQTGTGSACTESYEVDVDAAVTFLPITTGPMACAQQAPDLNDGVDFWSLPVLP
ncbi:MAG: hypothetical protein QOE90_1070 [Thermoplasmata archaeon]|nr:hypothetical protein [Thermoplasmata archaeon]